MVNTLLLLAVLICIVGAFFVLRKESASSSVLNLKNVQIEQVRNEEKIQALQAQLHEKTTRLQEFQEKNSHLQNHNIQLQTQLQNEQENSVQKIKLLQEAKESLSLQFKDLSAQALKQGSETASKDLKTLLEPLKENIKEFKEKVEKSQTSHIEGNAKLLNELHHLKNFNSQISQEAQALTRALKQDTKTQGNWGETTLRMILEQSGLQKNLHYIAQPVYKNENGSKLLPDFVIKLPQNRQIIIDSKVSLVAYERYVNAQNNNGKKEALKAYMNSVNVHIKQLSNKSYNELETINCLDFVFMFMPIEGAFLTLCQENSQIFNEAFKQKVLIVSPTNLTMLLRVIENIWHTENQQQKAQEIAKKAAGLYDKFYGFIEDLDKVGSQIAQLQKTYDDAKNKLHEGRGNLVRQVEGFKKLGVMPKKSLQRTSANVFFGQ